MSKLNDEDDDQGAADFENINNIDENINGNLDNNKEQGGINDENDDCGVNGEDCGGTEDKNNMQSSK